MQPTPVLSSPGSRPKVHRLPSGLFPPAPELPPSFFSRLWQRKHGVYAATIIMSTVMLVWLVQGFSSMISQKVSDMAGAETGLSSPISGAYAASEARELESIVINADSQTIVGQMARMPDYQAAPAEVQTMSDVDKEGNRELLSIISKY